MSYDLYLSRQTALSQDEFTSYFTDKQHYEIGEKQVTYQNEDTGVYFTFDLASAESDPPHQVAFNLNYFRPHFFGLEAASELNAVIEHFEFDINDPQNDGMGDGPFSIEGFLRGWNHGNEFGYRAILGSERGTDDIQTKPQVELDGIWRWNYNRNANQASLGDDIFVPKIFWVILDNALYSAIAWPDGIAALIPEVNIFVIRREEFARRRFFFSKRSPDTCYIFSNQFENLLAPLKKNQWPLSCRTPQYKTPSHELGRFIRGLKCDARQPKGIAMDSVLNREMAERSGWQNGRGRLS